MDETTGLRTPRLALYPLPDDELAALAAAQSDPHMKAAYGEMLAGCRANPQARLWYTCWALHTPGGEVLGDLCFKGPPGETGEAEIGYGLYGEGNGGHGYMTEGVAAALAWAFGAGAKTVTAEAEAGNAPSLHLLAGLGFVPAGMGEEGPRFALSPKTFSALQNANVPTGQVISPMAAAERVASRPPLWLDGFLRTLPGAVAGYKVEWGWHRYLVGGKQFAAVTYPGEKHPVYGGRLLVNLKCDPLYAGLLQKEHPGLVAPAFYMDKVRWIAVFLDGGLPQTLVTELCAASHKAVLESLPKKTQKAILEAGEGNGK